MIRSRTSPSRWSRATVVAAVAAVCAAALSAVVLTPSVAGANGDQHYTDMVVINPGGGRNTNGSDGLQIVLNAARDFDGTTGGVNQSGQWFASDQIFFANTGNWLQGGPILSIAGKAYGESGAAGPSWDSVTLVSTSGAIGTADGGTSYGGEYAGVNPASFLNGSTTLDDSTTTGSGSAHLRYEVTVNDLLYVLDRTVTYTYPNDYYVDGYSVTIPDGNIEIIKFYAGGDAAPGNSDYGEGFGVGPGFSTSAPRNTAFEVNPDSGIYLAYSELDGGGTFDGLFVGNFYEPYSNINAGNDIGFSADPNNHDAGLDLQWTVGSDPGTYTFSHRTIVDFRGTKITQVFAPVSVLVGTNADLVYQVTNTDATAATNIGFSASLPSGLTVAGAATNSCGGTVTATSGGTAVSLNNDGAIAAGEVCEVSVPVSGAASAYTVHDQDLVLTNLTTGYGVATLSVTDGPTVTTISPTSGPTRGGTSVTITGSGFVAGATVTVGGVACTSVSVTSETELTCTTGAHAAGVVDVVVTVSGKSSTDGTGLFTYVAPPPPPTGLVLSALSGRQASLVWAAPVSGPAPTGYQVRCMPVGYPVNIGPGGKVVYTSSVGTSVTVTGLTGGETYRCYARARYGPVYASWGGDSDEGPLSAASNSVWIARTTPPVPVQVAATTPPQPSGQSTSVSFVAPENRSGAPVTSYDVRCTSGNGGTTRTASGPASPVTVTSLSPGRTYRCATRALNSVGASAWSTPSASIVVPAGPPTNVRVTTSTATATVTFTAPDGGPPPQSYRSECRSSDGGTTRTGTAPTSPVTVTTLTRAKTYTCRVWAVFDNAVLGPPSAPSTSFKVP